MRSCLKKIRSVNKQALNGAKKSFTLVELSIVLLILSLLVGSLLTGRQLVERAEINKIISEIDYYQKNVLQFQDTFQFLPGNMDEDNCQKNTILYKTFYETAKSNPKTDLQSLATDFSNVDDYCKDATHTVNGFVGLPYFASYQSYTSIYQAAAQMAQAGLIKSDTIVQKTKDAAGDLIPWASGPIATAPDSITAAAEARYLQPTSFNEDGLIMFAGFDVFANDSENCSTNGNIADASCGNSRSLNFIRGSASYGVQTELSDATFAKALDRKNAIVMFYNDTSTTFKAVSANSSGIVSPSQMNKIDQKMDDGRPGTGRVLALKSGLGRTSATDSNGQPISKSVCYNELATNVSNAYYLNSDDAIYGCNIVAVIQR
ncbi:MAG: hypothetical protein IJ590_00205 [Rickettsiales bacterium]|nr:hypothetical protein [Rickettsiales bacterium]